MVHSDNSIHWDNSSVVIINDCHLEGESHQSRGAISVQLLPLTLRHISRYKVINTLEYSGKNTR